MELVELGDCDFAAVCALNPCSRRASYLTEPEMEPTLRMGLLGALLGRARRSSGAFTDRNLTTR